MFFKRTKRRIRRAIIGAIISAIAACGGGAASSWMPDFNVHAADLSQIPDYTGSPYTILNDNEPEFDDGDFTTEVFENYSELDDLWPLRSCLCEYLPGINADGKARRHRNGKAFRMAYREISGYH